MGSLFLDRLQDTRNFNFLIIKAECATSTCPVSTERCNSKLMLIKMLVKKYTEWTIYLSSFCAAGIEGACMSSPTSELLTFTENLKHWRSNYQHTIELSKHMFQQDADQHQAAPESVALKWAVPFWFSLALIQPGEIKNRPEAVAPNPKAYFPRKNKCFLMCTINPSGVKSWQCKSWGSKFPVFSLLATEYLFVLNSIVFLLVNLRACICSVWMS